jgi:hypothetical protein
MLFQLENLKELLKFSDHLIQLQLLNQLIKTPKLGLEATKDQLLFHLMIELLDKCSVTLNQDFAFSIKKDQAFYLMPLLKLPKHTRPQENH